MSSSRYAGLILGFVRGSALAICYSLNISPVDTGVVSGSPDSTHHTTAGPRVTQNGRNRDIGSASVGDRGIGRYEKFTLGYTSVFYKLQLHVMHLACTA